MDLLAGAGLSFSVVLAIALLVAMYAMAMMNRAIQLLQYQITVIENDLEMMNEEFKMIANRDQIDLSKIKPRSSD